MLNVLNDSFLLTLSQNLLSATSTFIALEIIFITALFIGEDMDLKKFIYTNNIDTIYLVMMF